MQLALLPGRAYAELALGIGAAFALQLAWVAWSFGQLRASAVWLALCASVLGWLHASYLARSARMRWLATYHAALGAMFLVALLVIGLFGPGFAGVGGSPRGPARRVSEEAPRGMPETEEAEGSSSGTFRSVILLAEVEPSPVVAPLLRSVESEPDGVRLSEPLTIPFFGAYWFFRLPAKSPGANAFVHRGSTAELSFRSADLVPLEMEARQSLGRHLDLRCCERIDVVVTNADPYLGAVSLELRVADTSLPGRPESWLGLARVPTVQGISTLRFPVPSRPVLARFDELILVFHRALAKRASSAKVAVDRFVLMPR